MTYKTSILNLEVIEGPALSELVGSGLDHTICVFKLSNGEWLEGFAETVNYNNGSVVVKVLNVHDDERYLVAYSAMTRTGRVLELL